MFRRLGFIIVGVMYMATGSVTADQLMIFEGGKAHVSIVCPSSRSLTEDSAVQQLRYFLQEMTGSEFVVADHPHGPCIVVGEHSSLRGLLPAKKAMNLVPESFNILIHNGSVFIVGADDRGVLYGVYRFLEKLGCRWLAPAFTYYGDDHSFVPRVKSLVLNLDASCVEKPALKYRKLYVEEGHSHTAENLLQLIDWMPKRRFNTLVVPLDYGGRGRVRWDKWRDALTVELKKRGIIIEVGGHGYENFLNAKMEEGKIFETHPEWFGMNEEGLREAKQNRVFCTSNDGARRYVLGKLLEYLEAHPEIEIFDFWPPDGAKWCQCAQCIRLGDPVERHALMVSQASGAIRRLKRSVKLECIAYSSYVAPPAKRPVRKDILVDFCPINQCFEHQIDDATSERNADYVNHLREWRKRFAGDLSVYSYYRKYAWNSLPILLPHYMQHDLKFYAAEGINGISSYAEPGDWATYELNHYILGALAWNPASDMDSLVEEFAICRFGEFADLGCEAYSLLESRARRFSSIPFTAAKSAEEYDGAIAEFQGLLQRVKWAEEITDSSAVLRVLGRLRFGLEYLLLDIMLTKARVMGEGQTSRLAILSEMDDLLTKASDEGVFLTERLRSTRLASRYGLGDE